MIDDTRGSVDFNEAKFETMPPAFFDEAASANAKPVQPIPKGRIRAWVQRARNRRPLVMAKTKALALVLIGGLALGILGGTMLVKVSQWSRDATPANEEEIAETTEAPGAVGNAEPSRETRALDTFATPLQRPGPASSANRRHRVRARVQSANRAYRVAVIR